MTSSSADAPSRPPRRVTWIDGRATRFEEVHGRPAEAFLEALLPRVARATIALDVGCGRGALALHLAPRLASVVGADRDEAALREAAREAGRRKLRNVKFYATDLEAEAWSEWAPAEATLAWAHLCASPAIFTRAAERLPRGSALVVAAFGEDQWKETGSRHRFSFTALELRASLEAAGFRVEALVDEAYVVGAPSFEVLEDGYFTGGRSPVALRWKEDGRWERLRAAFRNGANHLTEHRVVARAVRDRP